MNKLYSSVFFAVGILFAFFGEMRFIKIVGSAASRKWGRRFSSALPTQETIYSTDLYYNLYTMYANCPTSASFHEKADAKLFAYSNSTKFFFPATFPFWSLSHSPIHSQGYATAHIALHANHLPIYRYTVNILNSAHYSQWGLQID